jgi:hypothetical protein
MEKMNITSAQYYADFLTGANCSIQAIVNGVEWSVPLNPDSTLYAEIMRQVEAGELTIEPADE